MSLWTSSSCSAGCWRRSLMAVLWGVQRARGNAGIVDVAWSLATAVLGAWFAYVAAASTRGG
jgi:steroid 5-alpha reductase family enzyme